MRIFAYSLVAATLAAAAPAVAQSAFDGTWKADIASLQVVAKPDRFLLKDGTYSCETCIPAFKVKADGTFQPVAGKDYYDHLSVKPVDAGAVQFDYRKGDKVVARNILSVSADGKSLTARTSNTNNAAGALIEATAVQKRVGAAVAGAHAISGSWAAAPAQSVSDTGMQMTIKVDARTYTQTSPMGETLTATFGGGYAPNVGDPGKTMTKAERLSPTKVKLTDMRAGKIVGVTTLTVAGDGSALTGEWSDPRDGSRGGWKAKKI